MADGGIGAADRALLDQAHEVREVIAVAYARLLNRWPSESLRWHDGLLEHRGEDGVWNPFVCLRGER
jgi:hypothetical protein